MLHLFKMTLGTSYKTRPVSIFSNFSKVYEKCLTNKIATFFQNINVGSEKHSGLNGVLIVLAENVKKR